jgi:Zn-dependent peptidase ImmA (M78 family)
LSTRQDLASMALERSLEVREEYGYDYQSALCIYELADRAQVKVRFVDDVSMEGVYAALAKPTILISSLRPLVRRNFTCAHELGHHFFRHGSTIDELRLQTTAPRFDAKEFIAEAFAGFLLMPTQGLKKALSRTHTLAGNATPDQLYAMASAFGVGYETLVSHMSYSLRLISRDRAAQLRTVKVSQIRKNILGFASNDPLVVADTSLEQGTIDVEVGTLVLLPMGTQTESPVIEFVRDVPKGRVFRASRSGLARVSISEQTWGVIVRVSRFQYAGLATYRHLEEPDDEPTDTH